MQLHSAVLLLAASASALQVRPHAALRSRSAVSLNRGVVPTAVADLPAAVPVPAEFIDNHKHNLAGIEQYEEMYKKSVADPEGFWSEIADTFHWCAKNAVQKTICGLVGGADPLPPPIAGTRSGTR